MVRSRWLAVAVLALLFAALACNLPSADQATQEPVQPGSGVTAAPGAASPEPSEQPVVETAQPTAEPGLFPAPLYFIGGDGQVWRLEVDGTTLTQITSEPEPVLDFDVSQVHGEVIYISGNDLFKVNASGGDRLLLLNGPTDEEVQGGPAPLISSPLWAPDGRYFFFTYQGVTRMTAAGYSPRLVVNNDPWPTDYANLPDKAPRQYFPRSWSPDGSRLLLDVVYWPEGGGLAIVEPDFDVPPPEQRLYDITNPDPRSGLVCCYPSWSLDGSSLYFAGDSIGYVMPGLWRVDAASGVATTLIYGVPDDPDGGVYTFVAYPQEMPDGQLYSFMGETTIQAEGGSPKLTMTRSAPDGVSGRSAIRSDSYVVGEALWAADGSGAVIVERSSAPPPGVHGQMLWLASDDSPAVVLAPDAHTLRWGSRNPPRRERTEAEIFPGMAGGIPAPAEGAPSTPGVLPAPLYFKGEDGQIWRIETDGITLTRITSESVDVANFDVSRAHGGIVFVSGNDVIRIDALGGGRVVLLDGAPPDEVEIDPFEGVGRAVWSPDGGRIAVGWKGVLFMSASGADPQQMISNTPIRHTLSVPDLPEEAFLSYAPREFSPDGSRLLLNVSFFPEAGGIATLDLNASQPGAPVITMIKHPENMLVCCYESWSPDGQSIYFANDSLGMIQPGLWRVNVATGQGETLLVGIGPDYSGPYNFVAYPQLLGDGLLYFFLASGDELGPETEPPVALTMSRAQADGVTDQVALRADAFLLGDVLWAVDGSGAVIVDMTGIEGHPQYGPLRWLAATPNPAVTLPGTGSALQWGK
jgi:Tol biopolymer transport system component